MLARKLTLAAVSAALIVVAAPAASIAKPKPTADVCNEAENSWRGAAWSGCRSVASRQQESQDFADPPLRANIWPRLPRPVR